ncbi:MAG: ABC transporter substrate-binding protein [Lautropia sp.]|nr:ABC transporter substrate-binding protein [Lautropia sp.]
MKLKLISLVSGLFMMGSVWAAQVAPNDFIETISNEVLTEVRGDAKMKSGDLKAISTLVDEKMMPHVNFERMTALAVGRSWREATDAQKQSLMKEFRTLLIRTYANAFATVKDQKIQMRPYRGDATKKDTIVRSQVVQPGAESIQLDYRLEKAGETWRIYDVNVMGVWLVQTYRNQFAQEISAGGIDGLIKSLASKNAAAAAKRNG